MTVSTDRVFARMPDGEQTKETDVSASRRGLEAAFAVRISRPGILGKISIPDAVANGRI